MSARPIPGIVVGSVWSGRESGQARVLEATAGHVRYRDQAGEIQLLHHFRFRERFIEPYNAHACRSQFAMSVANLVSFHAFWSPALRRFFARSTNRPPEAARAAARGSPALPDDAFYVNTYAQPINADVFFADLNDELATRSRAAI